MKNRTNQMCVVCDQPMSDNHVCPEHVLAAMATLEEIADQECDVDYPDVIPGYASQDDRYSRGFAMMFAEGCSELCF